MKTRVRLRSAALLASLALMGLGLLSEAPAAICAQIPPKAGPLEITISATQSRAVEPFPLDVTLYLHNAGNQTLWLYQPASDASTVEGNPGGSSVAIRLQPKSVAAPISAAVPAVGTVLRAAGFSQPKMLAVKPGGSSEENLVINAVPSSVKSATGSTPIWGAYRLSIAYSAGYPNGDEIRHNCNVDVWSGSISSGPVEVALQPPAPSAQGAISGTVVSRHGLLEAGILVSLADDNEHLVTQVVTGSDGGFRFEHLPFGRYWVTVRDVGADRDTSFFEHADLSLAQPDAQLKLIMLDQEEYESKQLLHKPVFFFISNGAGNPVAGAELKILWSNGPVLENKKIDVDENGVAAVDLIPGDNYVTVTKRHCPKVDQLANVAPGGGIDGFNITFNCEKQ